MTFWRSSRRGVMTGMGATLLAATRRRAVAAPPFKTVEPGLMTIANSNEMPTIAMEDGKLIGSDAEIIAAIAKKMGLGVKSAPMEWSATVQSAQSGRADIVLGNMAWTPARAEMLLITDAIYYGAGGVSMKKDKPFTTRMSVNNVKGFSIGTVTGYSIVPEMKRLPSVSDAKLYDNFDSCMRDLVAGRLDFALFDPLRVDYMIIRNPSWNLKMVPFAADPGFPQLTSKQQTVMGMNQENFDLFDAVNAGVRWIWQTRQNAAMLQKYGMSRPDYLIPSEKNPRVGVDRDAVGNLIGAAAHQTKDFSSLFV